MNSEKIKCDLCCEYKTKIKKKKINVLKSELMYLKQIYLILLASVCWVSIMCRVLVSVLFLNGLA